MQKMEIKNKKYDLKKEYAEALKNENFKNLVSHLKIDENTLIKNTTKIDDSVEELKNCKNCKGLYMCKNKVEGHVFFPEVIDESLRFVYTPCKYQKKLVEELINKNTEKNSLIKARMKDIDISDKNRLKIIKWLKEFYDKYDVTKECKGLYLHGSFGSGKTFLIMALLNELQTKKHVNYEIIFFPEFLRELKDDFSLVDKKLSYYENVEILFIDDIGAESVSSWSRDEILGSMLQYRMNNKLTTFFTSNLNIEELERHLALTKNSDDSVKARRIVERVKQLTIKMELVSQNRRT